jgi:pyrroline-5-carboxylate reductase
MAPLAIYLLNVGQADTSVIQTPAGNIVIVDAVSPEKLTDLLAQLRPDREISQLIIPMAARIPSSRTACSWSYWGRATARWTSWTGRAR